MRERLLSIMRSPLTGAKLKIQSALEWYSDGILKFGVLESVTGELFPVLAGIPIFTQDKDANLALQHIQSGTPGNAVYTLLNGQPLYWVESAEQTFQNLLYQFVGRWSADYFYYRRSDPTFLAGISLLRVARDQTGWAFDLGCGCGHNTKLLSDLLPDQLAIGVDSTFKLLYLARHFIAPNCDFVCCDLEKGLPFVSEQAGVTLCSDTFSFINNQWSLAREMIRLLHETGQAIITRLLLHPPDHWDTFRFRIVPLEQYLLMFEHCHVDLYSDDALRKAYLSFKSIDSVSSVREIGQSCSVVITKGNKCFSGCVEPFLTPYDNEKIYMNPLYALDPSGNWTLVWPSKSYYNDYEDQTEYLPQNLTFNHASVKKEQLEILLRSRVLLSLPNRYGNVQLCLIKKGAGV